MMSRVAREVAPCDQLQLIGDKLHELKRLLPILHFHSLLETVERTPVDPNGSDPELANTSDNGADGVSKPKSYLRLPEIPALVTSCDLRGSKALVLLGYRDCSYETHRYMVEVENLPEDDPLVLGLQQHLEQHWLQMDIHSLLKDGLKEESIEWNSDSTNNLPLSTDISNGTTAFSHIGQDSLDTDGGAQSRDNRKESRKHHLCHRQSLHRRHRHHPHQRSQQNHHHHHHHHRQSCSQCQATQRPHLLHEHQSFVKSLSRREELNTRVLRVSEENPSDPQRNGEEKTKTIKFEIQPVTSDILLSPSQSAASSSSSESEPDKAVDSCVQALLTPDNNNSLLVPNSPDNNNDNNNNNNDDDDDLEETSSNNEVSLKEEDPERWKQLNLSIARVTQELIVLLENEGSTLSEDEDEDGYEEEEESDDGGIVGDIDFNNILNQ